MDRRIAAAALGPGTFGYTTEPIGLAGAILGSAGTMTNQLDSGQVKTHGSNPSNNFRIFHAPGFGALWLYRGLAMDLTPWFIAARLRTLSLSMTPVAVGTALAWAAEGKIHWLAVIAALLGSMFIQLGTNLHNDAINSERGGDGPDRIGPPRATASGLLNGAAVKRGALTCYAIAALMGLYLSLRLAAGRFSFSAFCRYCPAGPIPADTNCPSPIPRWERYLS